jgi:hypothetical protein
VSTSRRDRLRTLLARASYGSWAALTRAHPELPQSSIFRALAGERMREAFVVRLALALGVGRRVLATVIPTVAKLRPKREESPRHNERMKDATPLDDLLGGLTDREIQRRAGVSPTSLRAYRRGELAPREGTISKLAKLTGKPVGFVRSVVRATIAAARGRR